MNTVGNSGSGEMKKLSKAEKCRNMRYKKPALMDLGYFAGIVVDLPYIVRAVLQLGTREIRADQWQEKKIPFG